MAHLDLTPENRTLALGECANAWQVRCSAMDLRRGTRARMAQLEAFLQGVLAALTTTRVLKDSEAATVAFLVAAGRGEEVIERWAGEPVRRTPPADTPEHLVQFRADRSTSSAADAVRASQR